MKILAVNWRDIKNPEAGGAEIYLHEILKRLVTRGHEVTLISSKFRGCKESEEIDGIKIIRIGNKYLFNFVFFWHYITKLRNKEFDVVIDSVSKIPLCIPLYVRKQISAIIYHIHGKTLFRELILPLAIYVYLTEKLLIPIFYKKSTIITISESTKEELIKFGIPSENIFVICCGIDNKFTPGDKSDLPTILYFGRVKKYKRIDNLIKAFKYAKEKVPEIKLIIAGKGDNYKELIALSKEFKIFDSIKFVGEVSEREKVKLFQKAWIFVTPSEKEGWGITVIESSACGTPCIAYNVPGLKDSIKHGYNGLLVREGNIEALANAMTKVLKDDGLRNVLSRNAIKWAKRFSWDKSADEFERVILMSFNEKNIKG